MDRPITELPQEWVKYIEYIEGCLNGSSELILALNTVSRVFAVDINMLCDGDIVEWVAEGDKDVPKIRLTFLSGDAKDKTFERLMVLFDKFDKIKALSQHFKGAEQAKVTSKIHLKAGGNPFEHVIRDLKNNGNTKV